MLPEKRKASVRPGAKEDVLSLSVRVPDTVSVLMATMTGLSSAMADMRRSTVIPSGAEEGRYLASPSKVVLSAKVPLESGAANVETATPRASVRAVKELPSKWKITARPAAR